MLTYQQAQQILDAAESIYSAQTVVQTLQRLATDITQVLSQQQPLVLCVMGGAVVFAGQLLPQLRFPLDFDYVDLTRYDNKMTGGEILWRVEPRESVKDRVVLVLDDILDEGITLAAIRDKVLEKGAKALYSAVLTEKETGKPKPFKADFVGLTVPDRYVFGFGMDIHGLWRNLPAIYAVKD
ncbi:hypoxanthine-guanine phosphoribosyltransferase [Nitrosomonas sp.]|uniref:hypoxanthine-guanine phosphoribosyltransferase n=1 Tax=Nitrosomonas sp. TaxID=42353 RepID=UPI002720F928|nr:hypoxanthine-guanine phosphoribosyltransferase [Nitrosomonas sp.]MDO8895531.1 hypoxanthine-guanine phosphoribosyltransferase [Nitrosomonas sp.]MDP1785872.1 hypoxanthine-guanine phosphoribosyltransferase [Nitrosomonas sp.]